MRYSIGFSTNSLSLSSKIIRWFTRSKASHSFLFLNKKVILEAASYKVKAESWSKFKKENKIISVFEIKQDPQILETALDAAIDLLGEEYDLKNVIGMGIVILVDFFTHIRIKNPLDNKKQFQCSEYLLKYLKDAQIPVKLYDEKFVDPQILMDYCINNPQYFVPIKE